MTNFHQRTCSQRYRAFGYNIYRLVIATDWYSVHLKFTILISFSSFHHSHKISSSQLLYTRELKTWEHIFDIADDGDITYFTAAYGTLIIGTLPGRLSRFWFIMMMITGSRVLHITLYAAAEGLFVPNATFLLCFHTLFLLTSLAATLFCPVFLFIIYQYDGLAHMPGFLARQAIPFII